MDTFAGALVNGILVGGVYVAVALGMVMIFKATKVVSLAHGAVLMLLAYLAWDLSDLRHFPLWGAWILTILVGMTVGWILNRLFLRPVIGRPLMVPFLVCLVLAMVVRGVALLCWQGRVGTLHSLPEGTAHIGGASITYAYITAFLISMVMFIALVVYFRRTKMGLLMRCVAEEHNTSRSMGLDVRKVFSLSWIIACALAAVSGILLGSLNVVEDAMGSPILIRALPAMLLGGMESIPGALVGGIILGMAEVMASTYVDPHIGGFRDLMPFILIVAILLIRPYGLFGEKTVERI